MLNFVPFKSVLVNVSLLGRVHCCVGFIVRPSFIVRPRSFLVIVHCWGGSIVAWVSLLVSVSLLARCRCLC